MTRAKIGLRSYIWFLYVIEFSVPSIRAGVCHKRLIQIDVEVVCVLGIGHMLQAYPIVSDLRDIPSSPSICSLHIYM
jgi:hypothetical protein